MTISGSAVLPQSRAREEPTWLPADQRILTPESLADDLISYLVTWNSLLNRALTKAKRRT